jgi:hypothetical protein
MAFYHYLCENNIKYWCVYNAKLGEYIKYEVIWFNDNTFLKTIEEFVEEYENDGS